MLEIALEPMRHKHVQKHAETEYYHVPPDMVQEFSGNPLFHHTFKYISLHLMPLSNAEQL